MNDRNSIDYEPGDVSPMGETDREKRDLRRWRFMQAMSLVTMILVCWSFWQSYQQEQDRARTNGLVVSAQQRACDLRDIRARIPASTPQEKALTNYYAESDTVLDCTKQK